MSMVDSLVQETVKRYIREYDRYKKLADTVFDICQVIVQKNLTIRATVQHRAKSLSSLTEKLQKSTEYSSVDSVFDGISDLAGVRIITYQECDRPKVVEEIRKTFTGKDSQEIQIDIKDKNGNEGKYYKATHCQVVLTADQMKDHINLIDTSCEIQVCSLLSHVYNEIEHDLQYKPRAGSLSADEKLLIDQLGLITRSGDITIRRLLEATSERMKQHTGEFVDVHDFVIRMGEMLGIGTDFTRNAGVLYDEFIALGLNSPETIVSSLLDEGENLQTVAEAEFERLHRYLLSCHSPVNLDPHSSDLLLLVLLRRKLPDVLQPYSLHTRTEQVSRIQRIALLYKENNHF